MSWAKLDVDDCIKRNQSSSKISIVTATGVPSFCRFTLDRLWAWLRPPKSSLSAALASGSLHLKFSITLQPVALLLAGVVVAVLNFVQVECTAAKCGGREHCPARVLYSANVSEQICGFFLRRFADFSSDEIAMFKITHRERFKSFFCKMTIW